MKVEDIHSSRSLRVLQGQELLRLLYHERSLEPSVTLALAASDMVTSDNGNLAGQRLSR